MGRSWERVCVCGWGEKRVWMGGEVCVMWMGGEVCVMWMGGEVCVMWYGAYMFKHCCLLGDLIQP